MKVSRYGLGIGSNLGNKENFLSQAIEMIIDENILSNIKISKIFKSKALLKENSPQEWDLDYLNLAIVGSSNLIPLKMLEKIKAIEHKLGRKTKPIWSPREIDIDILVWSLGTYFSNELTIPHKELLNRDFALLPLTEIWPKYIYPLNNKYHNKTLENIVNILFSK